MARRWLIIGLVLIAVAGTTACVDVETRDSTPTPGAGGEVEAVAGTPVEPRPESTVDSTEKAKTFRWQIAPEPGDILTSPFPDDGATPPVGHDGQVPGLGPIEPGTEGAPGSDVEGRTYVWPGETRSLGNAPATEGNVAFVIPNDPPTASAGPDMEVLAGDPADLSGEQSTDINGEDLTYRWQIISEPQGSLASLANAEAASPRLETDVPGKYELSLVVNDGIDDSTPDTVLVIARPWFTDVTDAAGVLGGRRVRRGARYYEGGYGSGVAWGDYNNDGDPDLYLTRDGRNILYRNNGDGSFTNVAVEAGVDSYLNSFGAAWGDFNNDGDLDLYVVNNGEDQRNVLYRNNGDGTFTDMTAEAGVDYAGHSVGATWVDLYDGWLALFVSNLGVFPHPRGKSEPNLLYRNNADGTFAQASLEGALSGGGGELVRTDQTRAVRSGFSLGAVWFDYDGDGDMDLFIASESGVSRLYRNDGIGTLVYVTEQPGLLGYQMPRDAAKGIHVLDGNGRFVDVTRQAGLFAYGKARGAVSADYDNDGNVDLFVTGYDRSHLWRNNGDGTFTDVAVAAGISDSPVGWGAAGFLDFDNDGYLDLYVAGGTPSLDGSGGQTNRLYRNNGDGTFADVTNLAGVGGQGDSRGVAFADCDGDGDTDIYVVNADGPNVLYRNEIGSRKNWIRVRLLGVTSNTAGIGARVEVITRDGVTRLASPSGGTGYVGQSDKELLFGLGDFDRADLKITWPSGSLQDFWGAWSNDLVRIRERTRGGW